VISAGPGETDVVDPQDEALVDLVRAIDDDGWSELDGIVDELSADARPYEWRGGDRTASGAIQMPWVAYGESVQRAREWLVRHGVVTPLADWTNWDGRRTYTDAASVDDAPVADVVRLATSIVRGDRFFEGAIAAAVDSGVLVAILSRLRRWHTAGSGPGG